MSNTSNILVNLGQGRIVYREISSMLGLFTAPRSAPQCLTPELTAYRLGLSDVAWAAKTCVASGATTYYVRVAPIYDGLTDPNGDPLIGSRNTQSQLGVTFTFEPYPLNYPCTGYRVYAGTVSGTLYYQGELTGRWNTTFVVGTTWTYSTATPEIAAVFGPPQFASAIEVFQSQGSVNGHVYMGGGLAYSAGFAKVSSANAAAVLTGGTGALSAFATWAAITNGSFRMKTDDAWHDYTGINFAGAGSMANVATTIQTAIRARKSPVLYGGLNYETSIAKWNAITAGSFSCWVSNAVLNITGCNFSASGSMTDVAAIINTRFDAALAGSTCTFDTVANRFILTPYYATPSSTDYFSHLAGHSAGTGTDISFMMACRETSTGAVLDFKGKGVTTETVAWSTDHFVFTHPTTGYDKQLSFLEAVKGNKGTDISGASYADCLKTAANSTYTPGQTAKRTVLGLNTDWGQWAASSAGTSGMKLMFEDENIATVSQQVIDTDLIYLDEDYGGSVGYTDYLPYVLKPWGDRYYISALGNPFSWAATDIIELPTNDSDSVTAFAVIGSNVAIFMNHHLWLTDGVAFDQPRLIDSQHGVVAPESIIGFANSAAFFTGREFMVLSGGRVENLDPALKMKSLLTRLSSRSPLPHGVLYPHEKGDLLIWFIGLDNSSKCNYAFVFNYKTGNWWLHYVNDANASAVVRDNNDKPYMITGTKYGWEATCSAFTLTHSKDYKSDGGTTLSNTKQGKIDTVGAVTKTAPFLTCGVCRTVAATWATVTNGAFSISIDGETFNVGPITFAGLTTMAQVATAIQGAVRAQTGLTETVAWSTDHFVITSSSTTAESSSNNGASVGYLTSYRPYDFTDISGKPYMNGWDGYATKTGLVNQIVLTLDDFSDAAAALFMAGDGEKGVYIYICDSTLKNGQYGLIIANTATTVTVSPSFSATPSAGWYWFIGGIVPQWMKWFDFGSAHTKSHILDVAITTRPETSASGNYLGVHTMQDLSSTVRTATALLIGGSNDTVNTVKINDKPATQNAIRILRPSSQHDLQIEDIAITHKPIV